MQLSGCSGRGTAAARWRRSGRKMSTNWVSSVSRPEHHLTRHLSSSIVAWRTRDEGNCGSTARSRSSVLTSHGCGRTLLLSVARRACQRRAARRRSACWCWRRRSRRRRRSRHCSAERAGQTNSATGRICRVGPGTSSSGMARGPGLSAPACAHRASERPHPAVTGRQSDEKRY